MKGWRQIAFFLLISMSPLIAIQPDSIFHNPRDIFYVNSQAGEIRIKVSKNNIEEAYVVSGPSRLPMNIGYRDGQFDYYIANLAPFDTTLSYSFLVTDGWDSLRLPIEGTFLAAAPILKVPNWAMGKSYYFIQIDGFNNGDILNDPDDKIEWTEKPSDWSAYGGDIEGIFQKIEYLSLIDPDIIMLSPIFSSFSNHKLNPRDYAAVDPAFGDTTNLKRLITAIHGIDKKIVLSVVFTHTGVGFPAFSDVLTNGNLSRYIDWYRIQSLPRDSAGMKYDSWRNDPRFPLLNLRNQALQNYLIGFIDYWAHFGFDGFYIGEQEEINTDFMTALYNQMKEKYPEILLISSDCRLPTVLHSDACLNRTLTRTTVEYFINNTISTAAFDSMLHSMLFTKPSQINCASLIGFYDNARRIGMTADQDLLQTMYAFIFTFCGSPLVVSGDEIGMTECAPLNWGSFNWEPEQESRELQELIRNLIKIRKENPEISSQHFFTLYIDDVKKIYAYDRGGLIVILNSGSGQGFVELPAWDGTYIDLMNSNKYTAFSQKLRISVDPVSFRILKREI
jgi:cyclomaltodextrinase